MFRESIKVLDCSIRDGGLVNNHKFSFEFVQKVYRALAAAGVDYMEAGYKNSDDMFSREEYGPWKFCDDDLLWKMKEGVENGPKVSVMADIGRADMSKIKPRSESPYDMVRVACYARDIDKCIAMVNEFHDLGYETTINIMAASRDNGPELDEALDQAEKEAKTEVIYIVDSFGYFYQENIDKLAKRYKKWVKTKKLGFHGHNNQQLAFSNTIQAIINHVDYLDCSIYGMGRGAGNCPTELLLTFLKNPKFDVRPILDTIANGFIPLQKEQNLEWGYIIPQMITGAFNYHPESAIKFRKGDDRENYRAFWMQVSGQ